MSILDAFDWSRYAVGGAASRADSFTGLNPDFASAVAQMLLAADQELGPQALRITSAYRSPELQAQLYQNAIKKYGSEQAARKWVAPPGKSKHNTGHAVDFAGPSGGLLRDANSREAQWIAQNAGRFGLHVPMSWEPWEVRLKGGAPAGPAPTPNGNALTFGNAAPAPGATPMDMGALAGMFGGQMAGVPFDMGMPVPPQNGLGQALAQREIAAERKRASAEDRRRSLAEAIRY